MLFKYIMTILMGFSAGVIISGGVFAFITIIGIIPRLAQKTKTQKHMTIYEDSIVLGGILGSTTMFIDYRVQIGAFLVIVFGFCIGIFYGCLSVAIAEILDVVPIFTRRAGIQKAVSFFILCLGIGKMVGSLIYFIVPEFFDY